LNRTAWNWQKTFDPLSPPTPTDCTACILYLIANFWIAICVSKSGPLLLDRVQKHAVPNDQSWIAPN